MPKTKIAVFIDAANCEISLKNQGLKLDYREMVREVEKDGKIFFMGYYSPSFKTAGQNNFFTIIKKIGFKIITKNVKVIKQREKQAKHKANFDVEITFDAAVNYQKYNNLILFSGDSDFVYLVKELQKRGIKITVISTLFRTARELRKQVDKFVELKNCPFIKKKLPLGSAHNNLSTAQKSLSKENQKVKRKI